MSPKAKVDYVFVDHPTFLERVYGQTGLRASWVGRCGKPCCRFSALRSGVLTVLLPQLGQEPSCTARSGGRTQSAINSCWFQLADFTWSLQDFADNQARFAYFCKAALKAIQELPLGGAVPGPRHHR